MTHTLSSPVSRTYQRGFSLLELSIALAVIGIVVAGGLSMSTSMVDRTAYVQTGNQMDEIEKALAAYVAVNNSLPCPADPSLSLDQPDYGLSSPGACADAPVQHTTGTGGAEVAIGMLPVRTLGLRDRMGADEYGNRYTYAVTEALTTDAVTGGYLDPNVGGAIIMADADIVDMAYVVVSHGGDAKGAYRYETASNTVACASGQDVENCNGDATFRDTRFNRGSVAGNWFDDTVRFKRKEMINLTAGGASSVSNQFWEANGDHIYNTNIENVGIGIANPTNAKLDVLTAAMSGTAVNVSGTGGSDNTGINIGTATTGINIDNVVIGMRVDVDSGLGNAIFATTSEDNVILYRNQLGGEYNTGMHFELGANSLGTQFNLNGANTKAVNINGAEADQTGIEIELDNGGEDYWDSDAMAFRSGTYHPRGYTRVELGGTQYAFNMQSVQTSTTEDFDAQGGRIEVRTECGGGSDCTGLTVASLDSDGTNTGGAHIGIMGLGGVTGVQGQSPNTGVYGMVWAPGAGSGSSVAGVAVAGDNRSATGVAYGVSGSTVSTTGGAAGAYGSATATTGATYGVYGSSNSNAGYGVYGYAARNSGTTYGVYGRAISPSGYGVYGTHTLGTAIYGTSAGTTAHFVNTGTGTALRAEGGNWGADLQSAATNGVGVRGYATSSSGVNYGVQGYTSSNAGRGVYGYATSGMGTTFGVYGHSVSSSGYGIYCDATTNALGCGGNRAWTNTSDMRLKKNIVTLDEERGLDAIRKLRPVTYEWKDEANKTNHLQIGFIAQEVEKVLPEIVGDGADQTITLNGKKEVVKKAKAMAYAELTAPLVRAVQQLADKLDALFDSVKKLFERVDAQDAKIKALEDENKALKDRLDALEAKIAN